MIRHDPITGVTIFACSRPAQCTYCEQRSVALCDHPTAKGTCSAPMCAKHRWRPNAGRDQDFCRIHRRRLESASRAERAISEKKTIPTLMRFTESKYPGYCRDKDCNASWQAGDPCWWDKETRLVYCDECGEALSI